MLDLSNLGKDAGEDERPLAGWREWKFRSDPLHTIHRDDVVPFKSGKGVVKTIHPPPSPFLQRYSYIRDIPIGAVIHLLAACPFLRYCYPYLPKDKPSWIPKSNILLLFREIDLANVALAADYAVSPLGSLRTGYHPTAFTSLLFVSDVPKSFTWREGDTSPLSCSSDLVDALTKLHGLKKVNLKGAVWVTRDVAEKLIEQSRALDIVDLRECGMYRERKWTIKGRRIEAGELIREEKVAEIEREREGLKAQTIKSHTGILLGHS